MRFDAAETAIAGSNSPAGVGVQRPETHIPDRPFSLPLAPRAPTPAARWSSCGWVVLRGAGAAGAALDRQRGVLVQPLAVSFDLGGRPLHNKKNNPASPQHP